MRHAADTQVEQEQARIDRNRERRRLVVGAVVVVIVLTAIGLQIDQWRRGPARPPAEVERIAQALRSGGHGVDRVARNANGGWSVVFDDGEVQWFKSPSKAESRLHPVRVMFAMKAQPHIIILDLHVTVFAIVMSGRRQGSTLELGTATTSAEEIAAKVRAAVSGTGR